MSALVAPDLAETGATVGTEEAADPVVAATAVEPISGQRPGRHAKPADHAIQTVPPRSDAEDMREISGWPDASGEGFPAATTPGLPGSAITDRLPLPVRAVVEGLPTSVRQGRAGLQPAHAAVVVLVVLLGLAVTALLTGLGRPRVQAIDPGPASTILATGTPATAPNGAAAAVEAGSELVVHVAGKVAKPGIVRLPAGSRVIDAIQAAGGADEGVDLTPLNLARVLADGEQVAVGIDPPPQAATSQGSAGPAAVSLNSANADQLATLPGIGPTLAGRIVQWREQNGRFTAVDELLEVTGIGPAKYEAIAELVTL
jgi:competence protein ComEA